MADCCSMTPKKLPTSGLTTPNMDALPPELLKLILHHTIDSNKHGTSHLSQASRVCKRWSKVVRALLWKDIPLNHNNTTLFLREPSPTHHHLVQSLTLSTNSIGTVRRRLQSKKTKRRNVSRRHRADSLSTSTFRRLVRCIRKMDNLKTLSLYDDTTTSNTTFDASNSVDQTRIQQLLESLPSAVKNLEIDIQRFDDPDLEAQHCLCCTISRYLPTLENLRLRVPKLCPSLLTSSTTLRSLVINMSWMDMYNTCTCRQVQPGIFGHKKQTTSCDDRALFVSSSTSILNDTPDLLPALTQFTLTTTHNFDEDWCGPSHLMLRDDFLHRQTTAYPLWCVNEEAPLDQELWAMRVLDSNDPNARDLIGPSSMMESFVECSIWSQNPRGVRHVLADTHQREPSFPSQYVNNDHATLHTSNAHEMCNLWVHEKEANNECLLAPLTVPIGETPFPDTVLYGACPDIDESGKRPSDSGCEQHHGGDDDEKNERHEFLPQNEG